METKNSLFEKTSIEDVFVNHYFSSYKNRELKLFNKIKSLGYDNAMKLVPKVNLDMLDYGNQKGIYNELQIVAYAICWKSWGRLTDIKLKFRSKPFGNYGMRVLDILQID